MNIQNKDYKFLISKAVITDIKVLVLRQMEPTSNKPSRRDGHNPSDTPTMPSPGAIITPQVSAPINVPTAPAAHTNPTSTSPLATPSSQAGAPNETQAKPDDIPQTKTVPFPETQNTSLVPEAKAPPMTQAVPAMEPVKEKLMTSPHLDAGTQKAKTVIPSHDLAVNPASTTNIVYLPQEGGKILSKKKANFYHGLSYSLVFAVIVAAFIALLLLVIPLKSASARLRLIDEIVAIISLICCLGLLLRSNLARSAYVTINIMLIVTQGVMIYQLHGSVPPAQSKLKSSHSLSYYHETVKRWVDPIYNQGDERIILMIGELFAIYLLTTHYMQSYFEKR